MSFLEFIPNVEGFDTEYSKSNKILLCSSSDCYEYIPGELEAELKFIEFLYKNGTEWNVFYNIKYDFSVVLAPFYTGDFKDYAESGKDIKVGKYKITYVEGKSFDISVTNSKNTLTRHYFDIAQFYRTVHSQPKLDNVAFEFLGERKDDRIDSKNIAEEENYYENNRDVIIQYCQHDANLARKLGELFRDALIKEFGQVENKIYSQATVAKMFLKLNHWDQAYVFWDMINEYSDNYESKVLAFNTIFQSYHGGIFYVYQLGKTSGARQLDLNSAYTKGISILKDIRGQKLRYVSKYTPADYGFYKVSLVMPKEYPIPFRDNRDEKIYPYSIEPVQIYLTAMEIDFLRSKGIEIEILYGFVVDGGDYIFKDNYEGIYEERKILKLESLDDNNNITDKPKYIQSEQKKTVLNSTYGTFAQSRGGFTMWSNFVYASYITAYCRAEIWKLINRLRENSCKPIAIMTDGVLYTGDYQEDSKDLGGFKAEKWNGGSLTADVVIYMNGIYTVNGEISRVRGFPTLTADMLFNTKRKDTLVVERPVPLYHNLARIRNLPKEIAKFLNETRTIRLTSNLRKYDMDQSKLTFQYLKDNPLPTAPILLGRESRNWTRTYNKDALWKAIRNAQQRNNKQPKIPKEVLPAKTPKHLVIFEKYLHVIAGRRFSRAHERYYADPKKKDQIERAIYQLGLLDNTTEEAYVTEDE